MTTFKLDAYEPNVPANIGNIYDSKIVSTLASAAANTMDYIAKGSPGVSIDHIPEYVNDDENGMFAVFRAGDSIILSHQIHPGRFSSEHDWKQIHKDVYRMYSIFLRRLKHHGRIKGLGNLEYKLADYGEEFEEERYAPFGHLEDPC